MEKNTKPQAGLEVAPSQDPTVKGPEYSDLQVAPSDAPIVSKPDYSDLEAVKHPKDERYSGEHDPDDRRKSELVNTSGHVQEIDRTFGLFSICAMAVMSDNAWGAGGGSLVIS